MNSLLDFFTLYILLTLIATLCLNTGVRTHFQETKKQKRKIQSKLYELF